MRAGQLRPMEGMLLSETHSPVPGLPRMRS